MALKRTRLAGRQPAEAAEVAVGPHEAGKSIVECTDCPAAVDWRKHSDYNSDGKEKIAADKKIGRIGRRRSTAVGSIRNRVPVDKTVTDHNSDSADSGSISAVAVAVGGLSQTMYLSSVPTFE